VEGSDGVETDEANGHDKKQRVGRKKNGSSRKNEVESDNVGKENDDNSHISGSDDHKVNGLDKGSHVCRRGTFLGHGKANAPCEGVIGLGDKVNVHESDVAGTVNDLLSLGCLKTVFGI